MHFGLSKSGNKCEINYGEIIGTNRLKKNNNYYNRINERNQLFIFPDLQKVEISISSCHA